MNGLTQKWIRVLTSRKAGRHHSIGKFLLAMKLTAVFMLAAVLTVSAAGVSQEITYSGKNVPLQKIFAVIKQQTGYITMTSAELFASAQPVTVDVHQMPLENFLALILQHQSIEFSLDDKNIILAKKTIVTPEELKSSAIFPQLNPPISGVILDADGKPLAGATVTNKRKKVSASTNNDGEFSIKADEGEILVFSFVGYESSEIKITASHVERSNNSTFPTLTIKLQQKNSMLDETIVRGYGTTSRRTSTGSIAKVKGEELTKQNTPNPLLALQGRAAGVAITNTSGGPGANVRVQIRGRNSVAAGAEPLYIIDGVSMTSESLSKTPAGSVEMLSPLNSINPSDIESIEILKDADATAIYGSRGSNGVVLITTKKAKAGQSKFSLDAYSGAGKAAVIMDMLNTEEYLKLRREAFEADGEEPNEGSAPDLLLWDQNAYTDWPKFLYGHSAPITNIQSNLSGGDDKTRFLVGVGYYHQGTILAGNETEDRINAHLNVEHTSANKKLSAGFTTNISSDHLSLVGREIFSSYILPPNFPIYDPDGNLTFIPSLDNPQFVLNSRGTNKTGNVIANANIRYTLLPGLQLKTIFGYTQQQLKGNVKSPSNSMIPLETNKNVSRFSLSSYESISIEPQVDYSMKLGSGDLLLMAGTTFLHNVNDANIVEGANFSTDLLLSDLSAAANISHKENFGSEYKYVSVFGRATYNLKNRYFLNGTFRRDGSSRFGPNNLFGNFGAVGAAWLFSAEDFAKAIPNLSYGKLRASYGITGNDQINDYQYLETYTSPFYMYNGVPGLIPNTTFNGEYGWEENRKLEFALELGAFKNRVLFTAAWYRNHCGNQLVSYPLPSQTGFQMYQANLPALLENKGFEFELTSKNIESKNFSWTTTANISFVRNRLVAYPNLEYSPYATQFVIGQPISLWWGYNVLGIDKETGLPIFQDVNKDGLTTFDDYTPLGSQDPKFYGGVGNTFRYRSFELDVFFQFSEQNNYNWKWANYYAPGTLFNVPTLLMGKYWKNPGDNALYPRLTASPSSDLYAMYGDYWFSNATFENIRYLRLKNLYLSWTFPETVTKKLKMQRSQLFLQGQNLLTFSNVKGLDPESATTTPIMKTLTAGFKVTF